MELHAIVFCGNGNGLSPFTSVRKSGIPKALMPVANRPMVEYVLEWCDAAPFKEVTVVTDAQDHQAIKAVVDQYVQTKRSSDVAELSRMSCINVGNALETTGEIVQAIKDQIQSAFLLLPCDFITDLPPQVLIEAYRNKDDDELGLTVFYHNHLENVDKKLLKTNYTIYSEAEDGHQYLLDLYSKEFVDLQKALEVRTQMVWRYPQASVSTKLLDSFIYFCSKRALDVVSNEFSRSKASKSCTKVIRDLARRSWKHSTPKETMGFMLLPKQCVFVRCNNVSSYMEANRYLMKLQAQKLHNQPTAPKEKGAATIGADSAVGDDTTLGERTSVKRSVVGNGCAIGKRCRLTGCIVLDRVTIGDDVQLENCIIGTKAVIHPKSRLVNCNVEGSFVVAKGTASKGETLVSLEEMDFGDDGGMLYEDLSEEEDDDDDVSGSEEYDDYEDGDLSEDDLFAR